MNDNTECDRLSKVRVSIEMARWYSNTEAAHSRMWGCLSHTQVVRYIDMRTFDEEDGFAYIHVYHRESTFADVLGLELRECSGGPDARKLLLGEYNDGVPGALVGMSLFQMPRDLRAVFFVAVPETKDLDLDASHQQCIVRNLFLEFLFLSIHRRTQIFP